MKIAVVGTGYVGLVQGTCLAESGNDVVCVDKVAAKVEGLKHGKVPIYEPGLSELVHRNLPRRAAGVHDRPDRGDRRGRDRLHRRRDAPGDARRRRPRRRLGGRTPDRPGPGSPKIVVIKSTVPVGTNAELARRMAEATEVPFDVASNPEFLKEGAAIDDFNKPDRVVVGVRREEVADRAARAVCPVPPHRPAVPGHVARERRDDQVRRQLPAGHQDQLHQRDGQPVRGLWRRRQRRPPRDRPRPADRLPLPVPGRRLRRELLPQGHPRRDPHGAVARACPRG